MNKNTSNSRKQKIINKITPWGVREKINENN